MMPLFTRLKINARRRKKRPSALAWQAEPAPSLPLTDSRYAALISSSAGCCAANPPRGAAPAGCQPLRVTSKTCLYRLLPNTSLPHVVELMALLSYCSSSQTRGTASLHTFAFLISHGLGTASTQHPLFGGFCPELPCWAGVLLRVTQASAILLPPLLPPAPAAASLPAPLHSCLLSFPSQSHLKGILIVSPEEAGRHFHGAEKTFEINRVKVAC